MPMAWAFQRPWEDFFTVVQWDQSGAGKSFPLNDPKALAPTLTLAGYRDDAIELIELPRDKYGMRKVFHLGHSTGLMVRLSDAATCTYLLNTSIGEGPVRDNQENEQKVQAPGR